MQIFIAMQILVVLQINKYIMGRNQQMLVSIIIIKLIINLISWYYSFNLRLCFWDQKFSAHSLGENVYKITQETLAW